MILYMMDLSCYDHDHIFLKYCDHILCKLIVIIMTYYTCNLHHILCKCVCFCV